jgi:PII-like signaling protein
MVAVKGYFKDKTFHSDSDVSIPDGQPVIVTILDFPERTISEAQRQKQIFMETFAAIQADPEELGEEFDKVLAEGIKFRVIDFS